MQTLCQLFRYYSASLAAEEEWGLFCGSTVTQPP